MSWTPIVGGIVSPVAVLVFVISRPKQGEDSRLHAEALLLRQQAASARSDSKLYPSKRIAGTCAERNTRATASLAREPVKHLAIE